MLDLWFSLGMRLIMPCNVMLCHTMPSCLVSWQVTSMGTEGGEDSMGTEGEGTGMGMEAGAGAGAAGVGIRSITLQVPPFCRIRCPKYSNIFPRCRNQRGLEYSTGSFCWLRFLDGG